MAEPGDMPRVQGDEPHLPVEARLVGGDEPGAAGGVTRLVFEPVGHPFDPVVAPFDDQLWPVDRHVGEEAVGTDQVERREVLGEFRETREIERDPPMNEGLVA